MQSKYPNGFYRVSIKALIRDGKGRVLVVKEDDKCWDLPGGGLDHGENIQDSLKRELFEEIGHNESFESHFVGIESMFLPEKEAWLLWIVYEVTIRDFVPKVGSHTKEVVFKNPKDFENSQHQFEKLIHSLCG